MVEVDYPHDNDDDDDINGDEEEIFEIIWGRMSWLHGESGD